MRGRLSGFGADELVLESREKTSRAEFEEIAGRRAPRKRLAVDSSLEVDEKHVAAHRLARTRHGLGRPVNPGQPFEGFFDFPLVGLAGQALERDLGEVDGLDLGHEFDPHVVFEVGPVGEGRDLDLGLHRRPQAPLGQGPLGRVVDGVFQDLAQDARAVFLPEQRNRRFAGTETGQGNALHQLFEPARHLLFDVAGRNRDLEFAYQSVGLRFRDLHRYPNGGGAGGGT